MKTTGAVIKKLAAILLTDKKILKTVCGIVIGIIAVAIMPIVAILSIFSGNVNVDLNHFDEQIIENLDEADQNNIGSMDNIMLEIEKQMSDAEFHSRYLEAQTIYLLGLVDRSTEAGLVERLVTCFKAEQTDEELIAEVNQMFGINISVDDFKNAMEEYRNG